MRADKSVFSVIMILFASTIWISSVSALPQQETSLGVKITYPAKGQQVAIGKNLTLLGTSSYNATSNCGVFVIVDGVRPYRLDKQEVMIIQNGSTHLLQHMPAVLEKGSIE
jgi:hypothetical protein